MQLIQKSAADEPAAGGNWWDRATLQTGVQGLSGPIPHAAVTTAGGAGLGYLGGRLLDTLQGTEDTERRKRWAVNGGLAGFVLGAPGLYGAATRPRLVADPATGKHVEQPANLGSAVKNMFDQYPRGGAERRIDQADPVAPPAK